MGRPTTHYLSTLPSSHSSSHSSTSTSRRSRSSSSSPSPRKPRPSFLPIHNLNLPSPSAPPRGWVDEWFLTKEEWNAHPLNKERSPVPRPRRRRHRRRELSSSDEEEDQDERDARLHLHDGEEDSSPRATRRRRGPLFGNFESLLMEDEAEGRVGGREQEGGQDDGNELERMHGIASVRDSASQRDSYLRLLGVVEIEEEEDVHSPSPSPYPTHAHVEPQAQAQATSPSALSPSPLTMATPSSSNWPPAAEL